MRKHDEVLEMGFKSEWQVLNHTQVKYSMWSLHLNITEMKYFICAIV